MVEREEDDKSGEMEIVMRERKRGTEIERNRVKETTELKEKNDRIDKEKVDIDIDIDIEFDDVDNIVKLLHKKIVERTHKLTQINLAKFRRKEKEKEKSSET